MKCPVCGAELPENAVYCGNCGAKVTAPVNEIVPVPAPETKKSDPAHQDAESLTPLQSLAFMKIMAIACYVVGLPAIILSFIFLRDKKYVMSHANNGLVIMIFGVGIATLAWIPILGWLGAPVVSVFLIVVSIIGIVNAAKGLIYTMPILGGIRILKPVE